MPLGGGRERQLLVPLAFMAKQSVRDLDVRDRDGRPLPVLGTEANGLVAAATIGVLVEALGKKKTGVDDAALWELTVSIAMSTSAAAAKELARLFDRVELDEVAKGIIADFAHNFLLIAVLPLDSVGLRQVVKYSYHWEKGVSPHRDTLGNAIRDVAQSISAGFGLSSYTLGVDVNGLENSRSFHFECPAPHGLTVHSVRLPTDDSFSEPTDLTATGVGHAHGHYSRSSAGLGKLIYVDLRLDPAGLLPRVMAGAIGVFILLASLVAFPSLYVALMEAAEGATAVLLSIPALLLGLNARGTENKLVSRMLIPLRLAAVVLALLLFFLAGLLVLGTSIAIAINLIATGMLFSIALVALTTVGYYELNVSGRK